MKKPHASSNAVLPEDVFRDFTVRWTILDKFISENITAQLVNVSGSSLNSAFSNSIMLRQARLIIMMSLCLIVLFGYALIDGIIVARNRQIVLASLFLCAYALVLFCVKTYTRDSRLSIHSLLVLLTGNFFVLLFITNTFNGGAVAAPLFALGVPSSIGLASGSPLIAKVSVGFCALMFPYCYMLRVFDVKFFEPSSGSDSSILTHYFPIYVMTVLPMCLHYASSRSTVAALSNIVERIELAHQKKSDYVSKMSHELRSPLHAMLASVDLAMADPTLSASVSSLLRDTRCAGDSLKALVNNVLTFSKAESNAIVYESISTNVPQLVQSVLNMIEIQRTPSMGNVDFSMSIDPSIEYIFTDSTRLSQVLLNFIGNASKFTQTGSIAVRAKCVDELSDVCSKECYKVVWLEMTHVSSSWVVFEVIDTGVGIASERLPHIFDPFLQADSSITRKYGGTGLGLTISREIIRGMGGCLWVRSVQHVGCTFGFALPFAAATSNDDLPRLMKADELSVVRKMYTTVENYDRQMSLESFTAKDRSSSEVGEISLRMDVLDATNHDSGGCDVKILVVDDSRLNRKIFVATMKSLQFSSVDGAESAEKAMELFHELRTGYKVAFFDLHMPESSGYDLCETWRGEEAHRGASRCAIFAFTADTGDDVVEKCKQCGMNGLVRKPASRMDIERVMNHVAPKVMDNDCNGWFDV